MLKTACHTAAGIVGLGCGEVGWVVVVRWVVLWGCGWIINTSLYTNRLGKTPCLSHSHNFLAMYKS